MARPSSLPRGIWAPTQVFFSHNADELDLETIGRHAVRMARAGVVGIVTNGSNGEAVHLSNMEREQVTRTTRQALDAAGFTNIPIMAGASDQSLQGTLSLIRNAERAGAVAVLVLSPSFFRWAMSPVAIETYFTEVADTSPLPIFIYNYPAAVSGLDLDSDMLARLARHPNIAGTKFTCGNIGKLARVAALVATSERSAEYLSFSGVADAITPALAVGAHGGIVGAANVFPRACVNVYRLSMDGKMDEARIAQQQLALADWALTKRAIPGFKAILSKYHGYGGLPRQPVQPLSAGEAEPLFSELKDMVNFEASLPDFGQHRS